MGTENSCSIYSKEYFLNDCDGYNQFKSSKGAVLCKRLGKMLELGGIESGMSVLDVGCGRGELVLHCALKGADATGIDFSSDALDLAESCVSPELKARMRFLQANCMELDFKPGKF